MPRGTAIPCTYSRSEQRRSRPHECTNLPEEPLLVIVQAWQPPHAIRTPLICVNGLPISRSREKSSNGYVAGLH
eukprot:scaffold41209_cov78-Phaeocystis_antarctica.AAC.1